MINPRLLIAIGTILIAAALPVGVARAQTESPVDPGVDERPPDLPPWLIASRLGRPLDASRDDAPSGLSDLGAVRLREAPSAPIESDPLTLRTSGEDPNDLRNLMRGGDRWHLMSFGAAANSRPQDAKATAYGSVAYVPSLGGARPGEGLGYGPASPLAIDDREEPISLGFKAQLGGLEGGAEYRSVGKRLEPVVPGPVAQKDKEGTEAWLAQRLGLVRLRLSESDLSDNVDRNLALPRTTKVQTALSAEVTPARDWPVFGLTYAKGDSERTWLTGDTGSRAVERQSFDSVAGSAYYAGPGFDISGTSTYGNSRDLGRLDREMTSLYHDLSLTLRPFSTIVVMPSVSNGIDRYEWSDGRYQTGTMSLLLSYTPTASRWSLWTLGAYTTSQANDRTVDGRTMSVSGGIACGLGQILGGHASLALEAGYDSYADSIYPDNSTRGAFGLVLLKVTAF